MSVENRIRQVATEKLRVRVTRRRRGPFVVIRPDGLQTEHRTRREALQRLLAEFRCMDPLEWQIAVLLRPE